MVERNRHIRLTVVALLVFVAACTQGDPTGVTSCDQFGVGCTPEQLRTWEQAEHARINRRAAESATAFDEATRLWLSGGLMFGRDDDDERDGDGDGSGGGGYDGPLVNPLLIQCEPQRYQAKATTIGSDGGKVQFGPHSLKIPEGALDRKVVITGEIEISQHVLVDLSPHGLTFAKPAILVLAFEKCRTNPTTVQVAYVADNLDIMSFPETLAGQIESGQVQAELWHFSKYAVAY